MKINGYYQLVVGGYLETFVENERKNWYFCWNKVQIYGFIVVSKFSWDTNKRMIFVTYSIKQKQKYLIFTSTCVYTVHTLHCTALPFMKRQKNAVSQSELFGAEPGSAVLNSCVLHLIRGYSYVILNISLMSTFSLYEYNKNLF